MEARARRGTLTRILVLVLLALAVPAVASETRTVEVTADVFGMGRTPEQARHQALQRARDKAVAEVTGIHIAAQQLRLKSVTTDSVDDTFSYLVHTSTHGRIINEEVTYEARLVDDVPVYTVTLVAEVALEVGTPDPSFTLDLETEPASGTFRAGEAIEVRVTVSHDCYVTLLDLREDGSVAVLFPNEYSGDDRMVAAGSSSVPGSSHAFRIQAELNGKGDGGPEQILVVATLDPVPFRLPELEAGPAELAADGDPTLAALNRWLLQIPTERRVEAIWDYKVVQ